MYAEFHHNRLPHLLRNFDRCSMAHGVEIRMPFMDWRLVCFAFGLPPSSKIGGGFTKLALREAMRGIMPEELRTRKSKIGFSPPMGDWFNGAIGDWVAREVEEDAFLQDEVWDGPAIRDYVRGRHEAGGWTNWEADRVWPFLQTHLWRKTFFGGVPA